MFKDESSGVDLALNVCPFEVLIRDSVLGCGEGCFDVKNFENSGVLELRHGGAPPATVPENWIKSEKKG
jgi:hypothetical protein